jgi:hypothetical protein
MRTLAIRALFTASVLALLATSAPALQQESEDMQIVRAAEQLVQQQKPDEALAELQQIFDRNDQFAPAYFVAGLAYQVKDEAQPAFDNFVKATEYQPGWGIAHRNASFWAARLGNLEESWDHAIQAHLAGTDMSDAFAGLQTMGPTPADFEQRVNAYRVFVAEMNLEQYLASQENPFGRMIDAGGSSTNTDNVSNTKATGVADRVVIESAADRASVIRRTRQRIADSPIFGLAGNQTQAQYILVLEADEIGENPGNRPFEGYLNLLNAQSGEQAHRMRIQMRNIASQSDVNRDLDRIIGLLEEWAEENIR